MCEILPRMHFCKFSMWHCREKLGFQECSSRISKKWNLRHIKTVFWCALFICLFIFYIELLLIITQENLCLTKNHKFKETNSNSQSFSLFPNEAANNLAKNIHPTSHLSDRTGAVKHWLTSSLLCCRLSIKLMCAFTHVCTTKWSPVCYPRKMIPSWIKALHFKYSLVLNQLINEHKNPLHSETWIIHW